MQRTLELLNEITEKDVGLKQYRTHKYRLRKDARAIVFDSSGKFALVYSPKDKTYEIPGGGLEENETPEKALKREMLEEIGYDIKIDDSIGIIIQYRNMSKLIKLSYCFLAHTISKQKKLKLDKYEIAAGLQPIWVKDINSALKLIGKNPNNGLGERFSNKSNITFLEKAEGILKKRAFKTNFKSTEITKRIQQPKVF